MSKTKKLIKKFVKTLGKASKEIDTKRIKNFADEIGEDLDNVMKEIDSIKKNDSNIEKLKSFDIKGEQAETFLDSYNPVSKAIPSKTSPKKRANVVNKVKDKVKKKIDKAEKNGKVVGKNIKKIKNGKKGKLKKDANLDAFTSKGIDTPVYNTATEMHINKTANEVKTKEKYDMQSREEIEYREEINYSKAGRDHGQQSLLDELDEIMYNQNIKTQKTRPIGKVEKQTETDRLFDVMAVKIGRVWKNAKGKSAKPEARIALKKSLRLLEATQPIKNIVVDLQNNFNKSLKELETLNPEFEKEKILNSYLEFTSKYIPGNSEVNAKVIDDLNLKPESMAHFIDLINNNTIKNVVNDGIKTGDLSNIQTIAGGYGVSQEMAEKFIGEPATRGILDVGVDEHDVEDMFDYMSDPKMDNFPWKSADVDEYIKEFKNVDSLKTRMFQIHLDSALNNVSDPTLKVYINDIYTHHSSAFKLGKQSTSNDGVVGWTLGTGNTFIEGLLSLKLGSALSGWRMGLYNFSQFLVTGAPHPIHTIKSSPALLKGSLMGIGNWVKGWTKTNFKLYDENKFIKMMENNPYVKEDTNLSFADFMKENKDGPKFSKTLLEGIRHQYYTFHNPDVVKTATIDQQNLHSINDNKSTLGKVWITVTGSIGSFNAVAVSTTDLMAREWGMAYSSSLVLGSFEKISKKMVNANVNAKDGKDIILNHKNYVEEMVHALKITDFTPIDQQDIRNMIELSIDENGVVNPKMLINMGSAVANGFSDVNLYKYAKENRPAILDKLKDVPIASYLTFFRSWPMYYKRALTKVNPIKLVHHLDEVVKGNKDLDVILDIAEKKGWDRSTTLSAISGFENQFEMKQFLEELGITRNDFEEISKEKNLIYKGDSFAKHRLETDNFREEMQRLAHDKYVLTETWKNYGKLIQGTMGVTLAGIAGYYIESSLLVPEGRGNTKDKKRVKKEKARLKKSYERYTLGRVPIWSEVQTVLDVSSGDANVNAMLIGEDAVLMQSMYHYMKGKGYEYSNERFDTDLKLDKDELVSLLTLEKQFWESTEGRSLMQWMVRTNVIINAVSGSDRPTGTLKPKIKRGKSGLRDNVELVPK